MCVCVFALKKIIISFSQWMSSIRLEIQIKQI